MQRWKERLAAVGDVLTFDYEYMLQGRRRPDPLPKLIATHREALEAARTKTSGPIFLIGKSMGGRIGCHLSLEHEVSGLICLGYPLCAMGDRIKLRDQVLRDLRAPILFVQGTRDALCPLDLLENVRQQMTATNFLHVVKNGDHSLILRKKDLGSETQDDVDERIANTTGNFVRDLAAQS
jgi:predicted alpha/beta-hydrolase family hydrolase